MNKLTPMEEHFLVFYLWKTNKIGYKIHRTFFPKCVRCQSDDKLFKKITNSGRSANK